MEKLVEKIACSIRTNSRVGNVTNLQNRAIAAAGGSRLECPMLTLVAIFGTSGIEKYGINAVNTLLGKVFTFLVI